MSGSVRTWASAVFPGVVVYPSGEIPELEIRRIAEAVGRLLQRHGAEPAARLRIAGPPCMAGPVLIQANLMLNGHAVRVQAVTSGPGDALPLVVRLEQRIVALRRPWTPRPWPETGGTQVLAQIHPGALTRRKDVPLVRSSPTAAAAVLDRMDYEAHLFVDAETGEDAVVHRAGPTGVRIARQLSVRPPVDTAHGLFTVCPRVAPTLSEVDAVRRLCEHGLPHLFHIDPDSGRGRLLYRRYDGDLGSVVPVSQTPYSSRHRVRPASDATAAPLLFGTCRGGSGW
ncbi:sigma 54 modulation/S30EA ribosomal C-terminal domain-containing protein [Nocardia rhizosphaerae]|uniref:Sigma 54 modulation/S30EA ribosomal C-terminal domain-containing protein n=1 Tax=Nocardia rhizosphaerae TaxID=1691571 RepID=A0ABV8LA00_9NOCA